MLLSRELHYAVFMPSLHLKARLEPPSLIHTIHYTIHQPLERYNIPGEAPGAQALWCEHGDGILVGELFCPIYGRKQINTEESVPEQSKFHQH